jgi:hypothetical protein
MKCAEWIPVFTVTVLGLAACGRDRVPQEANPPPAVASEAAKTPATAKTQDAATTTENVEREVASPAEQDDTPRLEPVGFGEDSQPDKPDAGIEFKYQPAAPTAAGQPVGLDFALVPQSASPFMRVMVAMSAGLSLRQSSVPPVERNVQGGTEYWYQLIVVPHGTGTFNVSVVATLGEGMETLTRTFSIPVVIGSATVDEKGRKTIPPVDTVDHAIERRTGQESR